MTSDADAGAQGNVNLVSTVAPASAGYHKRFAVGDGVAVRKSGDVHRFGFCDVFTFSGDRISRVESYVVRLP